MEFVVHLVHMTHMVNICCHTISIWELFDSKYNPISIRLLKYSTIQSVDSCWGIEMFDMMYNINNVNHLWNYSCPSLPVTVFHIFSYWLQIGVYVMVAFPKQIMEWAPLVAISKQIIIKHRWILQLWLKNNAPLGGVSWKRLLPTKCQHGYNFHQLPFLMNCTPALCTVFLCLIRDTCL